MPHEKLLTDGRYVKMNRDRGNTAVGILYEYIRDPELKTYPYPTRIKKLSYWQCVALMRWHGKEYCQEQDGRGHWQDIWIIGDVDAYLNLARDEEEYETEQAVAAQMQPDYATSYKEI